MLNSKLARWSFGDKGVGPVARRSGSGPDDRLVVLTVREDKDDGQYAIVGISLHPRALKSAGWLPTDVISFGYNSGVVGLFRDPGGRKLGQTKECQRARARFRVRPEYAAVLADKIPTEVEIADGRIAFRLADTPDA